MERIDAAIRSLEDSLSRLAERLRGTEGETVQLFRGRIGVDEIQARLVAARANGMIEEGWCDRHVHAINGAAMLVASVPAGGGVSFQAAMRGVEGALGELSASLSDGIGEG